MFGFDGFHRGGEDGKSSKGNEKCMSVSSVQKVSSVCFRVTVFKSNRASKRCRQTALYSVLLLTDCYFKVK